MNGFDLRLRRGSQFENDVEAYCLTWAISVAKNGTEHTHPEFVANLRTRSDTGSKFVRFAPDGVCLIAKGVIHWEAKYAKNLEKDAYETYMAYSNMGCNVFVFFKHPDDGRVFVSRVTEIGFIPSDEVVAPFPPERRHPIEDGWIYPRRGRGYRSNEASGTPYREVDFNSLTHIPDFYKKISKQDSITPIHKTEHGLINPPAQEQLSLWRHP